MSKLDANKFLPQIWETRRHVVFLKRFLWIRARLDLTDGLLLISYLIISLDSFLDKLVSRFDSYPQMFSSVYDVQDFSLFDLKVDNFLFN